MNHAFASTRTVCEQLGLTEPALRHVLRRPGAPRPKIHPSARVFLWTQDDIDALRQFVSSEHGPQRANRYDACADQGADDAP